MMEKFEAELQMLKKSANYRSLRNISAAGNKISLDGKEFINFSSNDYLGIAGDSLLWNSFIETLPKTFLGGACSSRLLSGNSSYYFETEDFISQLYGNRPALIFNSGYHANTGIIPVLAGAGDLILSDEFNHASIIDGIRLSKAKCIKFRHNDYGHLEELLLTHRNQLDNVIVITESVFSMEGDVADLARLADLKNKYSLFLYIDEAHAIGVYGNKGLGLCESLNLIPQVDLILGTLSKALASQGAFVISNGIVKEILINKTRSLLFSTALPPISLLWSLKTLKKTIGMQAERKYLLGLSMYFRKKLHETGCETKGNSHIVPVFTGENHKCIKLSAVLQDNGCFALPVRYPTVPVNMARIRFSLNVNIAQKDIDNIIGVLINSNSVNTVI